MAVRLLVVGDLHIKKTNLSDIQTLLIRILKVIKNTNPDAIVLLGDTLHTHERINMDALSKATYFLKNLTKVITVFLLIGNHDRVNNSDFLSSKHPFEALRYWNNIFIIDKPRAFLIGGDRFIFVPYVQTGRFQEALDTLKEESKGKTEVRFIFANQEFKGVQMGPIKSIKGDSWDLDKPLVISGHIHDYQVLQKNIVYVGTPYMSKYGEKDNKVIMLATFNEKKKDGEGEKKTEKNSEKENNIVNDDKNGKKDSDNKEEDGDGYKLELIDLKMPKKKIIHLKPEELKSFNYDGDDEIKIKVIGDIAALKSISKSDKLDELSSQGINIMFKTNNKFNKNNIVQKSYVDIFKDLVKDDKYKLKVLNEILTEI